MKIYLIRHAHTQQVPDSPAAQWALSAEGYQQAQRLAQLSFWSQVTCIIHSTEIKTRLTVEPTIEQWGLPSWSEGRFDELRRPGWFEGDYNRQVAQVFAQPQESIGDWESAQGALERVQDGMTLLRKRFVTETVAVIGHGLIFSLYRAYLLGYPNARVEDWHQLQFASTAQVNLLTERLLQDFRPLSEL
ncbi:MAG: histidine phosphatase family protein [Chloroflexota bacterium]